MLIVEPDSPALNVRLHPLHHISVFHRRLPAPPYPQKRAIPSKSRPNVNIGRMMWLPKQQPWRLPPHPLRPSSCRSLLLLKAPLLCAFSTATLCKDRRRPPPGEPPRLMVDYLVKACGLSMAEATKAAKSLAHVKSTLKPDAGLRLIRQECLLDDAQIRRLVVRHPTVLTAEPEKTLLPKIRCLLEAGFSRPELARLVASIGDAIPRRDGLGRIQFWRNLLGSNQNLLKAVDENSRLLMLRLEENVFPTLSFLRSVGVSDEKIGSLLVANRGLVTRNLDKVKALVEQVKSLEFSPGSGMFVTALRHMAGVSKSTLEAKMGFLRSFGLSEAEVVTAIRRSPIVVKISQKKIQAVMDFLVGEAGCSSSYVVGRPKLLGFSMERRLVPRFRVMQSLRVGGLPDGNRDLYNAMGLSDNKFIKKYIVPNKEKVPGLLEVYLASSGKSIPR